MARLYLRQLQPGDLLDDVFVITNKQIAMTNTGKYYIKAFIGDKSMQVTARMWNATRDLFLQLPESGFVYIRGRLENYQGNLQVIVDNIQPPRDGSYKIEDLLPCTKKDIKKMFARLTEVCDSLQNRHVAAIVQKFLDDAKLMDDFRRAPAAMTFHHAFIGGLLEHTLNAMEVADAVVKFYPKLNRDLLIAGIFLHDLAKTWELKYETAFGYTDSGQLVGHIVKIALWIEEKARQAADELGEEIPRLLIDVLQHIVLSHHGEPEFGAAKVPATPEAIAVHVIENLDAKLTMALTATRDDEEAGDSNWTEYLKAFNVRMFKPDLAPADVVGEIEPAAIENVVIETRIEADVTPPQLSNPLFGEHRPSRDK